MLRFSWGRNTTFFLGGLLLIVTSYLGTDYYVRRTLDDFVTSWFTTQEISLAEGNLLTVLSENQRSAEYSETLKGIAAFDLSRSKPVSLASFGKPIDPSDLAAITEKTGRSIKRIGLFKYIIAKKVPDGKQLVIVFLFDPTYARYFFLSYNLFLVIIIGLFMELIRRIESNKREALAFKQLELTKLATQVAHDIRSPLAALDVGISSISDIPIESRQLIQGATGRIRDIANSLINANRRVMDKGASEKSHTEHLKEVLMSSLINSVLTEKRLQFQSKLEIEILAVMESLDYRVFSKIDSSVFARVLSNIIDNSVEAIKGPGYVKVTMLSLEKVVILKVEDNGKGIPPEIMPKLTGYGESHGKSQGSGLGLHHAKETLAKWGGSIEIKSLINTGTTVSISLPRSPTPDWMVSELNLGTRQKIVVLDDDPSIHLMWKTRFETCTTPFLVHNFFDCLAFEDWMGNPKDGNEKITYLIDHDLGTAKYNGLDLIERMKISEHSVLVTSRHEDDFVRTTCARLKIKILPKEAIGAIPLTFE